MKDVSLFLVGLRPPDSSHDEKAAAAAAFCFLPSLGTDSAAFSLERAERKRERVCVCAGRRLGLEKFLFSSPLPPPGNPLLWPRKGTRKGKGGKADLGFTRKEKGEGRSLHFRLFCPSFLSSAPSFSSFSSTAVVKHSSNSYDTGARGRRGRGGGGRPHFLHGSKCATCLS